MAKMTVRKSCEFLNETVKARIRNMDRPRVLKDTHDKYEVLLDPAKESKFVLDTTDERKIAIFGWGKGTWLWIGGRCDCFSTFGGVEELRAFANKILERLENKNE